MYRAGEIFAMGNVVSPFPIWLLPKETPASIDRTVHSSMSGHSGGCWKSEGFLCLSTKLGIILPSNSTTVQNFLRSLVTYPSSSLGGLNEAISWPHSFESTNLTVSPNPQLSWAAGNCHFHSFSSSQVSSSQSNSVTAWCELSRRGRGGKGSCKGHHIRYLYLVHNVVISDRLCLQSGAQPGSSGKEKILVWPFMPLRKGGDCSCWLLFRNTLSQIPLPQTGTWGLICAPQVHEHWVQKGEGCRGGLLQTIHRALPSPSAWVRHSPKVPQEQADSARASTGSAHPLPY